MSNNIAARQRLGIQKYGTTVAGNPLILREWLQHAYEEALDQAIYLKRAISEMEGEAKGEPGFVATRYFADFYKFYKLASGQHLKERYKFAFTWQIAKDQSLVRVNLREITAKEGEPK